MKIRINVMMYTKMISFLISYLFFFPAFIIADDTDPLVSFNNLVSESMPMLKDSVKVKKTATYTSVEFCPDNTCEIIRAPSSVQMKRLSDFTYLYLYYASGYTYLAISSNQSDPFIKSGRELANEIVRSNVGSYKQTEELELASCVLNNLAKGNNIHLIFSRYDEGERFESEENLTESLSVNKLNKTRKWYYKHCKKCQ